MRENLKLNHVIDLKHTISEVTSISLENDYSIKNSCIVGTFKVEGTYKTHGLSLNQEDIDIDIPYKYELRDNINEETIKVDVLDFNYSIEATSIEIDIEYIVEGEENIIEDFDDLEEFDRFLSEHEVDVINLNDEDEEKEERKAEQEELVEEVIECIEEPKLDTLEEEECLEMEERKIDNVNIENAIIENISKKEDSYITYHVYVCDETDTLESIKSKYNITEETLRDYNDTLEITCGLKLIIPCQDE